MAVEAALVAKAVAVAVARLAPKVQQDARATVLPPHVAAVLLKAHAVIVKIVRKEVLMARHPTALTIATTTVAMTVAPVATSCHVTLIRS